MALYVQSLRALPFTSKIKNMLYQYIGREYTYTRIREWEPKVKIVPGEIIESELDETYFTKNGFQKFEINIETKKTKKNDKSKIEIEVLK